MIHHVQRNVIDVLARKDTARYADLKPADMDGNQFTYHLKQLIIAKLIEQTDDGYTLTQAGKTYVIHRYEDASQSAHTIILMVIRCDDKLLMRTRKVQPMLGYTGFIHGEPVANESLTDSITKRVQLKTSVDIHDIMIHGSGLIRMIRDDEMESFSHAIIVSGALASENLIVESDETGQNFWIKELEVGSIPNVLPSCVDIIRFINSGDSWFDLSYEVE